MIVYDNNTNRLKMLTAALKITHIKNNFKMFTIDA